MIKSIVFPGQGSQKVGMGKEFFDNFQVAKDVFANVDDSLTQNLSTLIFNGPLDKLTLTENAQPAIMTVSIAILEVLKKEFDFNIKKVNFCAGHSLGEYTALAATDSLSVSEVAILLKKRGKSMQNALPSGKGSMAALIGLEINEVKKLITELPENLVCEIANYNSINQIVVSGDTSAIDLIIESAKDKKFKAIKLLVSAPFHCKYMLNTANQLKSSFDKITFQIPIIPIISNFSAKPFLNVEGLKKSLISQTFSTVRWYESIRFMSENGTGLFLEIGNGNTLSNMIKRMKFANEFNAISLSSIKEIEKFMRDSYEN
ncbi:MAG: [acyl-carrier-protein] S-malonyltransferase [Pelagibacterales bacterium]|nr:[acyl-carrier-protein] S-malonyltransferase [Pelagibacterales bacterium]OUU62246.1 MAG: [acyl-carrier-protein] S-malonyltransferase [Alphaproteobacteria bacterium TMED62]|tara:strand:- start:1032 stop:1982 length:951 start_codon:yes stop_codon:yes gene_type:complete